MVAIIFVKNVGLRNGGHFIIEPPKSYSAICNQKVGLIKKMEENRPPLFFNFIGGLFSSFFFLDSPFGLKLQFEKEPPQLQPNFLVFLLTF